ncbi:MAG TPA: hypothetical protein VM143_07665 [Acidimicrobiales bacterium]|nr:hypothetical protein [Acidimicrobiales bacterium]
MRMELRDPAIAGTFAGPKSASRAPRPEDVPSLLGQPEKVAAELDL